LLLYGRFDNIAMLIFVMVAPRLLAARQILINIVRNEVFIELHFGPKRLHFHVAFDHFDFLILLQQKRIIRNLLKALMIWSLCFKFFLEGGFFLLLSLNLARINVLPELVRFVANCKEQK